jgi:hypothetical protein
MVPVATSPGSKSPVGPGQPPAPWVRGAWSRAPWRRRPPRAPSRPSPTHRTNPSLGRDSTARWVLHPLPSSRAVSGSGSHALMRAERSRLPGRSRPLVASASLEATASGRTESEESPLRGPTDREPPTSRRCQPA